MNHPKSSLICVDAFGRDGGDHKANLQNNEEENFDFNISNCNNTEKITVRKMTSDKFFKNPIL